MRAAAWLAPLALLAAPAPVAAASPLTADPPLQPSFSPAVRDYAVRCPDRSVTFAVRPGARVAVDGARYREPEPVAINPGQSIEIRVRHDRRVSRHHARCLPDDFPTWTFRRYGPQPRRWYVMTVGSGFDTAPRPFIVVFDRFGAPVWWYRSPTGMAADAQVLAGNIVYAESHPGGFGADGRVVYRIRKPDGTLRRSIRAVGSPTDFHDLQQLGRDFLILTYRPREAVDLSAYGGPAAATVLDSEIQRIDRLGRVVWSWNSRDHIALDETGRWWPHVVGEPAMLADGSTAYDLTHINAIEPAGREDLLISLRHTDAVYRIRMSDGRVRWKLGGTRTRRSLRVVRDPLDYPLGGQHDSRLWNGTVTVYDNATELNRPPRAVRYVIDTDRRRATLVESVLDPTVPGSRCCGSARKLAGGNWLVGWGGSSTWSVLTPRGGLVSRLTLTEDELFSYRTVSARERALPRAALRAGMDAIHAAGDGG